MAIRPLCKELAEKARDELNEDPDRIASDIQHIKDWLAKQPHLRARTDDQWLVAFLRGCKYSLERTKEKLDLFYSVRTTAPELFRIKHTDPLFNEILDTGSIIILPKTKDPGSPRVGLMRPGMSDPDKYRMIDVMAVSMVMQKPWNPKQNNVNMMVKPIELGDFYRSPATENPRLQLQSILLIEDDNQVIAGTHSILDLEGATMGHFLQMTPMLMKKMVVIAQDAVPMRLKGAHYLNTPPGFETIFNAMKSLLNEKNKQRLYIHNKNYEEMYKTIPKEILPEEYGGSAGTIKELIEGWKKKIAEYNDWLVEDLQYGTDESKRPGKPKTSEEMFGLEGSFRQLQFD